MDIWMVRYTAPYPLHFISFTSLHFTSFISFTPLHFTRHGPVAARLSISARPGQAGNPSVCTVLYCIPILLHGEIPLHPFPTRFPTPSADCLVEASPRPYSSLPTCPLVPRLTPSPRRMYCAGRARSPRTICAQDESPIRDMGIARRNPCPAVARESGGVMQGWDGVMGPHAYLPHSRSVVRAGIIRIGGCLRFVEVGTS